VREFSLPALVERSPDRNLTDMIVRNAQRSDLMSFSRKVGDQWENVSAARFHEQVASLAKGLVASGVQPGDRVGLMSRTRYEWTLCDYAIWFAGGVVVPIYETSSPEQVEWILEDSGAVACVVEAQRHAEVVESVRGRLAALRTVWTFDVDGGTGGLEDLTASGREITDTEIERRRSAAGHDDLATIVYTSGTTGRPKGCEITHGNFLFEVENVTRAEAALFHQRDGSTLLFLPLAHIFARVIEVGCVFAQQRLGHVPDVKTLLPDLAAFQPTYILSVPRVFEKVFNSASQKAHAEGKGKIFDAAAATAIAYSMAQDSGGPGLALRLKHAAFDKLVYGKLRHVLGGRVRWAVSGGAPLGPRLGHFFRGIGVTVIEGYGLTETTAASTANDPDHLRIGTVGRPIPGAGVRITDEGEVVISGGQVFRGYWRNKAATAEAFTEDHWFHTGDIGELDEDGFLRITGRRKEILVTAAGKNVAPAVIEDRVRAHYLVSQVVVVGDGQPYIAALVTIDPEAFTVWKQKMGKPSEAALADLVDDPELRAEVQAAIDEGNKAVSKAESVRRFRILPCDLTEANGYLTPSLKVKRSLVLKEFASDIDALYS
jgi:long-chain acyl-CoA synthetase